MKKQLILFIILLTFILVGCTKSSNSLKVSDIKGYWVQLERDMSGDIENFNGNQYSYMEITDKNINFYTISFNEDEGYGVSKKYYKLEGNKAYYDYDELKDRSLEEIANSVYGGIFNITIDKDKIVLLEYSNGTDEKDGYEKNTYTKLDAKDWPIEE